MWNWIEKLIEWIKSLKPQPDPQPDPVPELPVNPDVGDDLTGSISEHWSLSQKEHDQTWRIRWPSYFANTMKIGAGSYCMVNDNRAEFRGYDGDNGSKRPSYTMPLSIKLNTPITCILYDKSFDKAVGWFKTDSINVSGRLTK